MILSYPDFDMEGFCVECGAPIGRGRTDRKFCSARCKNRYHNRKRFPPEGRVMSRVLKILLKNRETLAKLWTLEITTLDMPTLCQLGFNPRYFTSYEMVGRRTHLYTCLDFVYEMSPNRIRQLQRITLQLPDKEEDEDLSSTDGPPSSEDL